MKKIVEFAKKYKKSLIAIVLAVLAVLGVQANPELVDTIADVVIGIGEALTDTQPLVSTSS